MYCKTVTILLRIRVRGHFVMSITKNHESHYVTVLDNPHLWGWERGRQGVRETKGRETGEEEGRRASEVVLSTIDNKKETLPRL